MYSLAGVGGGYDLPLRIAVGVIGSDNFHIIIIFTFQKEMIMSICAM